MAAALVICDTDVIIDLLEEKNKRHNETKRIIESEIGLDNVIVTAII